MTPEQQDQLLKEIFGEEICSRTPPVDEQELIDGVHAQISPFIIQWCNLCGWHIKCPTCGNTCCIWW